MRFQTKRLKMLMSPMMSYRVHAWESGRMTCDENMTPTVDSFVSRELHAFLLPCHKPWNKGKRCYED